MGFQGTEISPIEANKYITKYINIKPAIKDKIDSFFTEFMKDYYTVGLQYRGTDKEKEATRVPYEFVLSELESHIKYKRNAKIFIATDDQLFFDLVSKKYEDKVVSWDSLRSTDSQPVHLTQFKGEPYKKGEDVLIDCILLSRCDMLFITRSNLSYSVLQFNPQIKFKDMTNRYNLLGQWT